MNKLTYYILPIATVAFLASCEGPSGPSGADANESCKQCHNSTVVETKAIEFEHSTHFMGEAFEEGTRTDCAPCHSHQGFMYAVKNNLPANNYKVDDATASLPGRYTCFTCHDSLHTTYTFNDFFPLTNEAAIPMVMWAGSKTLNFPKTSANLCAKCHQPRPVNTAAGAPIDYAALVSSPTTTYSLSSVSYRTGVHYGTQSPMVAGTGAVEFGSGYPAANSHPHAKDASCSTCHMATPKGMAGGHSFSAEGNFNGCNTTGCHSNMSATSSQFTAAVNDINGLMGQLAAKINAIGAGHDVLQKDADGTYHGYLDIYDKSANPTGWWNNSANGTPKLTLSNAQFGAIINFQLIARGAGKGIHNPTYIKKLLENTIAAI